MKLNIGKIAILGGLAYGAFYLATASKLKSLVVKLGEIAKLKVSFPNSTILLNMYVTNPNSKDVTYNEFFGTLFYNNQPLANIRHASNIILPGKNATTTIKNITIEVGTLEVINRFLDVIKAGGIVEIKGTLVADKLPFPIEQQIKLTK